MVRGIGAWLICVSLTFGLVACGDDDDSGNSKPKPHKVKDAGGSSHADAGDTADAAGETDAAISVDAGPPPPADLDELLDLGIADYLGKAKPTKHETITGSAGVADGSIVYDFDAKDGPVCFRGAPYNASLLDQGSDNLLIYMQGGGA